MGFSEKISDFLDKEINILLMSTGFDLSKKRFQLKLEGFPDYKQLEAKNFLKKHKDKLFSLCDPNLILKSYLSLDVENFDEQLFKKEEFECKLVLTESVYNSYDLGFAETFKSKITKVNFIDPKIKFAKFRCALIIGGIWYLEFGDTSFCVPKRLGGNLKQLYDEIIPFSIIKLKIDEIELKLAKVIAEWNCNYMYKDWDSKLSKFEGNCFHFVEEIFKEFQIEPKYNGSLYTFMNEIKTFGDAGPSIYPTDYSLEFQQKFKFSCIPEVTSHEEFDEILCVIDKKEPDFKLSYPHDHLIFHAIDVAFMLRSFVSDDDNFQPVLDIQNGVVCPNHHLSDYELKNEVDELDIDTKNTGSSPFMLSPKRKSISKCNSEKRKSITRSIFEKRKSDQTKATPEKRKSITQALGSVMRKSFSQKNLQKMESEDWMENSKNSRFSQNFRERSVSRDGFSSKIDRFSIGILNTFKSPNKEKK